ncbi:hypothetical protein K7887_21905 (plasmid) [Sutcliffiella horikoshii]|uniref:hypothetical protein n=1 Tax=Sutcliffiella horikoshii TaxID=79883 RepID=UPI001CC12A27|nr:hypothetical protein [Sutcliffiella horikoshii]UAL49721.1 hypothetical protein K7887_21905 [Sutcliffiella horikoshii]
MLPLTERQIDFLNRALDVAVEENWIGYPDKNGQVHPEDQEILSLVDFCNQLEAEHMLMFIKGGRVSRPGSKIEQG